MCFSVSGFEHVKSRPPRISLFEELYLRHSRIRYEQSQNLSALVMLKKPGLVIQAVKPAAWSSGGAKSLGQNRGTVRFPLGWASSFGMVKVTMVRMWLELPIIMRFYTERNLGNLLGTCRYRELLQQRIAIVIWERWRFNMHTHKHAWIISKTWQGWSPANPGVQKGNCNQQIASKKMWIWPTNVGTTIIPKRGYHQQTHFTNWYGDYQTTLGAKLGNLN